MRLLLDTHIFIWFFSGNSKLNELGRKLIEEEKNEKLISLATIWEMAIKQSKGKLILGLPLNEYIETKLRLNDFNILPIKLDHLLIVSQLNFYHNDPFDRLLIAQAIAEKVPILSQDSAFNAYVNTYKIEQIE